MSTAAALPKPLAPDRLSAAALALIASDAAAENLSLRADIAALVEAASVLTGVLAASGDCIKVLDLDGRILFVNDSGQHMLEVVEAENLRERCWTDFWPGNAAAGIALAAACAGKDSRFTGSAPTLRGNDRYWDVRVTPVRSAATEVTQILVITRDITEQRRLEAQKALLAGELEHRIKNMLTMVVAIASQTMRAPATMAQAARSFAARVQALDRAQEILTRTSWDAADIGIVVASALAPHRVAGNRSRFVIDGPALALSARRALALVLALHELATNATKYGALSTTEGSIRIGWRITPEAQLIFEWQEAGGPQVVPPGARGFGSRLVEKVLAADFEGSVCIDYAPSGVVCRLTAPVVERASRKLR